MATDFLVLNSLVFDDWSTPHTIPYGGDQAMKIHRLPGGSRVIHTLGPDEANIEITGIIYGNDAYGVSEALDAMRLSGTPVPLMFAGRFYLVIVARCKVDIQRFPQLMAYHLTCVVTQNMMAGDLGAVMSTTSDLVKADMATATSIIANYPVTTPLPGSGSGGIGSA